MYETGMVVQTIVASNRPDRVVTTGQCAGMTYAQVVQDVVDYLAWAQGDAGPGRGGWNYGPNPSYGDNSVAQWPTLALVAAEQWGINAPQFVKDELEYWVTYIQHPGGGSGYSSPYNYVNVAKTGGLLVQFYYLGDGQGTVRAQRAINYINSRWHLGPHGTWYGNKGQPYAMFGVFKGLELMQVHTIPNAPGNTETSAGDWWGDYAEHLVNSQNSYGYWSGYAYWGPNLATPWYIAILQATVFPVSVEVVVPGASCDLTGTEVQIHYSVERFEADGTLSLYRDNDSVPVATWVLDNFSGSETEVYVAIDELVGEHAWKAILNVTSSGGGSITAEDTDTTTVYETPIVSGIPDQTLPFESIDLDDYYSCECSGVDWAAYGYPADWTVTIDVENVVTVTAPVGAVDPVEITFAATFHWPGIDCTGTQTVTFTPNRPPVALMDVEYPEYYYVNEGDSIELDGSPSYDPDGDAIILYEWDLDQDAFFEVTGVTSVFSAADLDGPTSPKPTVYLRVTDEHGASGMNMGKVIVENVDPTIDAITAPDEPVNSNTQPVIVTVEFSDPAAADTHEVKWDWGDSESDTEEPATSPASASHTYADEGTYTVTVTVTDDDGGSDTETVELVIYHPPQVLKENAVPMLLEAANACTDKKVGKDIDDAIEYINNSLGEKKHIIWIDDSHLESKDGHKVFDEEKKAVKKLMDAIKEIDKRELPQGLADTCQAAIDALVNADKLLVEAVVADIDLLTGLDEKTAEKVAKELDKVVEEVEKANAELDETDKDGTPDPDYDKAIDHLKHAWDHGQKALEHAAK